MADPDSCGMMPSENGGLSSTPELVKSLGLNPVWWHRVSERLDQDFLGVSLVLPLVSAL